MSRLTLAEVGHEGDDETFRITWMFIMRFYELSVSYSQVVVFRRALERPFNFWTKKHVTQGFAWRPGSAAFRTLEDGRHRVSVIVTPKEADISSEAVRAIQVPFEVPSDGNVEIASIADSVPLQLPSQLYALRFECLIGNAVPEIKLIFMKVDNPTFEILRSDAELSAAGELLVTASPA